MSLLFFLYHINDSFATRRGGLLGGNKAIRIITRDGKGRRVIRHGHIGEIMEGELEK